MKRNQSSKFSSLVRNPTMESIETDKSGNKL